LLVYLYLGLPGTCGCVRNRTTATKLICKYLDALDVKDSRKNHTKFWTPLGVRPVSVK
jgi:hypothetical protein